jgi:hypothetical protein
MYNNTTHFCALGPGKAGTTWFYGFAKSHPEIANQKIKESYYFRDHFGKKIEYYLDNFIHDCNTKAFGDISNQYIFSTKSISRIKSKFPETKFLFFKRNELDRLRSAYIFELRNGMKRDVESYLSSIEKDRFDNKFLMERLLKIVKKQNVFIVDFERLKYEEDSLKQEISHFLGISDAKIKVNRKFVNKSFVPRNRIITKILKNVATIIRSLNLTSLLQKFKESNFIHKLIFSDKQFIITKHEMDTLENFLKK